MPSSEHRKPVAPPVWPASGATKAKVGVVSLLGDAGAATKAGGENETLRFSFHTTLWSAGPTLPAPSVGRMRSWNVSWSAVLAGGWGGGGGAGGGGAAARAGGS